MGQRNAAAEGPVPLRLPQAKRTRRENGAGSIWPWHDGRFMCQISLGGGRRRSHLVKTRGEGERWIRRALAQADVEALTPANAKLSVESYLGQWLAHRQGDLTPAGHKRYETLLRRHILPELGALKLRQLQPGHLVKLYAGLSQRGLAPATVRLVHVTLGAALQQATRWGILGRNVARLVDPPRPVRHEATYLGPEQARAFLAGVRGEPLEALWTLALTAGLRRGELLGLRWPDLDLAAGTLRVERAVSRVAGRGLVVGPPKSESGRRTVPLSALAVAALRAHRDRQGDQRRAAERWAEGDYLFTGASGQPLDTHRLYDRHWHPLLRRLGLPRMRLHDLRHSYATLLLAAGTPDLLAARMLGHSGTALLQVYAHPEDAMMAAAARRVDELLRPDDPAGGARDARGRERRVRAPRYWTPPADWPCEGDGEAPRGTWSRGDPTGAPAREAERTREAIAETEEPLVAAQIVEWKTGLPRGVLYKLAYAGKVPVHELAPEPWQTAARRRLRFRLSEVRAALERLKAEGGPRARREGEGR